MDHQTRVLRQLADELFVPVERLVLRHVSTSTPLDRERLVEFDRSLGGPSVAAISTRELVGGTLSIPGHGVGRYHIADREVFRPLQYCSVWLTNSDENEEWVARDIVEMSSAHIEGLVKRISRFRFLPLGTALRKAAVKSKIDPTTWSQVSRFTPVYNDAKHRFDHAKDTHMFSTEDAVLAYFVCRRLGQRLYPLATLSTDLAVFDEDAGQSGQHGGSLNWPRWPPNRRLQRVAATRCASADGEERRR